MGDAADYYLDGILDEETGELIDGEIPGYPRSPAREAREARQRPRGGARQQKRIGKGVGLIVCAECGKKFTTQQGLGDHCAAKHATNMSEK